MKIKALIPFIGVLLAAGAAWAQGPNERVHVLQKRDYSVKNKLEISSFYGLAVGDVFTFQQGLVLAVDYHLDEAFALELSWLMCKVPFWNPVDNPNTKTNESNRARFGARYTDTYDEVYKDIQVRASNADLAMITNFVGLSVQFSPLYGKWSLFDAALGHADFYLTAGGGVAGTEYRNPQGEWKDTGTYFVGNIGLGFRIFLARWFAIRIDLRDYAFAARVQEEDQMGNPGEVTTKIRNTLFITLGLSFLFLGEEPVQIWSPY